MQSSDHDLLQKFDIVYVTYWFIKAAIPLGSVLFFLGIDVSIHVCEITTSKWQELMPQLILVANSEQMRSSTRGQSPCQQSQCHSHCRSCWPLGSNRICELSQFKKNLFKWILIRHISAPCSSRLNNYHCSTDRIHIHKHCLSLTSEAIVTSNLNPQCKFEDQV